MEGVKRVSTSFEEETQVNQEKKPETTITFSQVIHTGMKVSF